jgi:competence protein ComEC
LEISFIQVGEGDAILVRDTNNFDILIDGGKVSAGTDILTFMQQEGVDDLEYMVATHADRDHIGGLIRVLEDGSIPVEQVLYNGYPGETTTWSEFAHAVLASGITLTVAQAPMTYTWGTSKARVLNPPPGLNSPDQNDVSLVIALQHGSNRFLFTGDIPSQIENKLIQQGISLSADVLKVAHHGSKYSSSLAFLEAVSPQDAVISVGPNSYGHPTPEVIARLEAVRSRIWYTSLNGTVRFSSDGETIFVTPQYDHFVFIATFLNFLSLNPVKEPMGGFLSLP